MVKEFGNITVVNESKETIGFILIGETFQLVKAEIKGEILSYKIIVNDHYENGMKIKDTCEVGIAFKVEVE